MKDIAIFGAGGWGKEVACLIKEINKISIDKWNLIGFFDDAEDKKDYISKYGNYLGGMEVLNQYPKSLALAIAIGNPHSLRKVKERIANTNVYFPNLISPSFKMSDENSFSIGEGNIIGNRCIAAVDVSIGSFNTLNSDIVMGHDVKIGNFNTIMPDIRISGEVIIGEENLLGVGSIILQQIHIGNNVNLGAGAVLMTKPKDGCTYIGNPAKLFKY